MRRRSEFPSREEHPIWRANEKMSVRTVREKGDSRKSEIVPEVQQTSRKGDDSMRMMDTHLLRRIYQHDNQGRKGYCRRSRGAYSENEHRKWARRRRLRTSRRSWKTRSITNAFRLTISRPSSVPLTFEPVRGFGDSKIAFAGLDTFGVGMHYFEGTERESARAQ